MKYIIKIETRKRGAIGNFDVDTIKLDAPHSWRAVEMVLALVNRNGLEPRSILSCRPVLVEKE